MNITCVWHTLYVCDFWNINKRWHHKSLTSCKPRNQLDHYKIGIIIERYYYRKIVLYLNPPFSPLCFTTITITLSVFLLAEMRWIMWKASTKYSIHIHNTISLAFNMDTLDIPFVQLLRNPKTSYCSKERIEFIIKQKLNIMHVMFFF